jgi:putative serine protease PepD
MRNPLLIAVAALGLAGIGGGIGAAIYSSTAHGTTTTILQTVASAPTTPSAQRPVSTEGLTINQIYSRTHEGVVDIKVGQASSSFASGGSGSGTATAEGSGFVYDRAGHIVTNQHVVDGATSISVQMWNGAVYKGQLVGVDRSTDLAVVKISAPASALHPLTLADSGTVQVGDGVVAIGSPFGLAETVTSGIVSAVHRSMSSPNNFTISDSIQTDAPINHGNSGGPLLNSSGQVIGINTQIESNGGGNEGVGFAVPSNTILHVAPTLVAGKTVKHAYLGVFVEDASTPGNATAGALTSNIKAGTPAARAGLKSGDVVVRLDSTPITSAEDLTRLVDSKQPGEKLTVTYLRDGKTLTTTITLGTRPT